MYRIMNLPALALMLIVSAGCTKDPGNNTTLTIEDMLVKNNEITGWVYSGSGSFSLILQNRVKPDHNWKESDPLCNAKSISGIRC